MLGCALLDQRAASRPAYGWRKPVTMYDLYIVRRTQIYLTDEEDRVLTQRRRVTGRTLSDLIRSAIDATYLRRRAPDRQRMVGVARATAGAWASFPETGEEYVERIRGSRRLTRLHGKD